MLRNHEGKIKLRANQTNAFIAETIKPGTSRNHLAFATEISGKIHIQNFKEALWQLVSRHDMLHAKLSEAVTEMSFEIIPLELLANHNEWPLTEFDATNRVLDCQPTVENIDKILNQLSASYIIKDAFDLYQKPLCRFALIKFAEDVHIFLLSFNHLIVDTFSINIIFNDLSKFYNNLFGETNDEFLPALPPFENLKLDLDETSLQERLTFWQENLAELHPINLCNDVYLKGTPSALGRRFNFSIPNVLINKFNEHEHLKGFSFFKIFVASLNVLLSKYTQETDFCIGFTSANRKHLEELISNNIVTNLANSIPLRLKFTKDMSFIDLLQLTKVSLKKALENQITLNDIMHKAVSIESKKRLRIAAPFTIFLSENKKRTTLSLKNTVATYPVELDLNTATFRDFGFNLTEHPDGSYQCFIEYDTTLYSQHFINNLILQLQKILYQVADYPFFKLNDINILLEDEKIKLKRFNATHKTFENTFQGFFQKIAFENPDRIALSYHTDYKESDDRETRTSNIHTMTYRNLEQSTTHLANFLLALGVKPNTPVGVCVNRAKVIPAMFSVLLSGGTLVTMESHFCESLFYKITSTSMRLILTDDQTSSFFDQLPKITTINIDSKDLYSKNFHAYNPPLLNIDDIAYIMFTSGTTSTPTGVMITQVGLANLCFAQSDLNLKKYTQILCTADPTFDAIFWDIARMIASAGTLHITPAELRFYHYFLGDLLDRGLINEGAFLPDLLAQLTPSPSMTHIVSMGASPYEKVLKHWQEDNPNRIVENGWGPTEATVESSIGPFVSGQQPNYIGKPITNNQIYILNPNDLTLCPYNVPGELHVGGLGVARGYLNNPELTKEKFIFVTFDDIKYQFVKTDNPSSNAIKLYKTGDYGCYRLSINNANNEQLTTIEYMGRKDRRVKINGVGFDLDSLEALMRNFPHIEDVALVSIKNMALIAYVVLKSNIDSKTLRDEIFKCLTKKRVPSVAFPKNIITVDKFPITKNGKIDFSALPNYQIIDPLPFNQVLTARQKILQQLWADVLYCPKEKIDINSSFLELGGNSLSLSILGTQLNEFFDFIPDKYTWIKILSPTMTIFSLEKELNSYEQLSKLKQINCYDNLDNNNISNPHRLFTRQSANSVLYNTTSNEPSSTYIPK